MIGSLLSLRNIARTSVVLGLMSCGPTLLSQGIDYSGELPRIAPTEPTAALSMFDIANGFQIQLVASEPLLGSPVAIEWDADGAMYVCEMRGYSENRDDGISRIAKLTDTDGDGVYDTRTEFATGLFWPTGLFPYDGGLFVGDAPNLLYLKDTDGDGKADRKQRVLTGFGTSNVQGLMNSFRWGLDNRIHIACSSVGGQIRRANAPTDQAGLSIRGRDLALNPRTYHFEPTSGAAQHGMSFDDWGRKFVSSNSDHIQQVMYEDRYVAGNPFATAPPARISIAADGPQAEVFRTSPIEPWRVVRTRLRVTGEAKGPIEGGGRAAGYFTGATGVTIYRGDAWPASWKGLAIIGDVGSNLIHRKRLQPNGLERIAKRIDPDSEFVTSRDIWFRPAQFANAPDGSLHVIDVYREVIEHPLSLPAEIKRHLDLTAGRNRGRIYRIVPDGFKPRSQVSLRTESTTELVSLLAHDNAWHRETAARLLFERQDLDAVAPLRNLVVDSPSPLGRMHAMYALDGLSSLDAPTLLAGLRDSHPQLRRHAVRLSENVGIRDEVLSGLVELVDDPSLEVRYQLAFTLGTTSYTGRTADLAKLLLKDQSSRWMRAAILTAIGADAEEMLALLETKPSFAGTTAESFRKQLQDQLAARRRNAANGGGTQKPVVIKTISKTRSAMEQTRRQAVINEYQSALQLDGDHERGKLLFRKQCSACHRVDGRGHELGPNLAAIQARGAETVMTAVLDPNREVNPLYLNYVLVTFDGQILSGMIVDEGATSMTLRRGDNQTETVLRTDIEQIVNTGRSLMPDGFDELLDPQAMADLLAYLVPN